MHIRSKTESKQRVADLSTGRGLVFGQRYRPRMRVTMSNTSADCFSNASIIAPAMKTISPMIRKEVIRRLVDEFQPETIYLFGSHAWGKPNEDSDMEFWLSHIRKNAKSLLQ